MTSTATSPTAPGPTAPGNPAPNPAGSPFTQPKAVWAVAFACVISFMGIGLVDPILPALASQLKASPSQVELLFTSYLVVTAVAMLITGWVSSRIGAKRTLIVGLSLIVGFAALAGASGSIGGIVGFRAGWGLGNALFIATSLAVIVASASGGFAGAIILYESALGIGIAIGPLLGGELGGITWRAPFFGVSALMAIALVATLVLVRDTPQPAQRQSMAAPLRALRHRGLLTLSLMALCYNWGFFTLLAYTPFPMHLGAHQLGYVFTGWGAMVAIFSIFVAPRLQQRYGTPRTLYVNFGLMALDLAVIAVGTSSQLTLILAVIVAGAFIGVNNTLVTQAVMTVSPVERSVASASYGFVRFIGGGLAPFVAGKLAEHYNVHVPFFVGAGAMLLAIAILASGHRIVRAAELRQAAPAGPDTRPPAPPVTRPIMVALDGSPAGLEALVAGGRLAARVGCPVTVVHVAETAIAGDAAIDREGTDEADRLVQASVARLERLGVPASGSVARTVGDHADVGRLLARQAADADARVLVVGAPTRRGMAGLFDEDVTTEVLHAATCPVLFVKPGSLHGPAELVQPQARRDAGVMTAG